MPTPRKGPRFGQNPAHNRLIMANLAASLFAAEHIVTTEAKAKALRPYAEHLITTARRGGVHVRIDERPGDQGALQVHDPDVAVRHDVPLAARPDDHGTIHEHRGFVTNRVPVQPPVAIEGAHAGESASEGR